MSELMNKWPEDQDLDTFLGRLAGQSPAPAYIRTLTSDVARSTMMSSVILAAEILVPGSISPAEGRGRTSNQRWRFEQASGLPWHAIKTERLGELRAALVRLEYAPASANKVLAAVRGVLAHAWMSGQLDGDAFARAKSTLKSVRGVRVSRGKSLAKVQMANLFEAALEVGGNKGARDACAIGLMCVGLRRAEVAGLRFEDFDPQTGRLIVKGKGNKERSLVLSNGSLDATLDWIRVRGNSEGKLLLQVRKDGKILNRGISHQAVYTLFEQHAKTAGIDASPHDLRRTMATEALNAGVDVFTLQALMGHASPATTQRYDHRGEETKKRALGLIHIPYGRWR